MVVPPPYTTEEPDSSASSSSGGGGGGGGPVFRGGEACGQPPLGGVDLDLWEVLWNELERVSDPAAVSDSLAENGVFSLEDVIETPNYRLGR